MMVPTAARLHKICILRNYNLFGVDVFCGAGGLSWGARAAGIQVIAAVDKDLHAIQTYRTNFPNVNAIQADVDGLQPIELNVPSRDLILFGGPPCQGFSTSNRRQRGPENNKNWMFRHFLKMVEDYSPEATVVENVGGIREGVNKPIFEAMLTKLRELGYYVHVMILRADMFGVPQKRTRVFSIATKKSIPLKLSASEKPAPTVWDAISDLPNLENGHFVDEMPYKSAPRSLYSENMRGNLPTCKNNLVSNNADHIIDRFQHVPQGGNWRSIPPELLENYKDLNSCHTGIYRRLNWREPSIVIGNFRKNMLIHPDQNRGLSVREAARLQSFPDNFSFKGSIGKQQQQVGNAVPPKLAHAVMSTVIQAIA